MSRMRVDQRMVDLGLAPSRAKAQALIMAGSVYAGDTRVDKAGTLVDAEMELRLKGEESPYVSRGGIKLDGALRAFGVDPTGLRCMDVGASTGGFTDCLLQRGATSVCAVDVGYGQLAHKLRTDPRVNVMERTNARTLKPEDIGGQVDLIVVDASFISLVKLGEGMARCLRPGGTLVALVKPQFEAGREEASRGNGVIRDPGVRARAIQSAVDGLSDLGFEILGQCDSPITGPKGNLEAFVHARLVGPI